MLEGYLSAYASSYGVSTSPLRFSNIYGPRSFHKGSVVAHFYKRILSGEPLIVYGDGSQTRDFLYVGDLVEAIFAAVKSDAQGAYQLGQWEADHGQPAVGRDAFGDRARPRRGLRRLPGGRGP